jgi:hypothetical protein
MKTVYGSAFNTVELRNGRRLRCQINHFASFIHHDSRLLAAKKFIVPFLRNIMPIQAFKLKLSETLGIIIKM